MADDEDDKKPCMGETVALGPDLGGIRPIIHHRADHTTFTGFAKIVPEGETPPDTTTHLHLQHREGNLFDVIRNGPAQVSTPAYRSG